MANICMNYVTVTAAPEDIKRLHVHLYRMEYMETTTGLRQRFRDQPIVIPFIADISSDNPEKHHYTFSFSTCWTASVELFQFIVKQYNLKSLLAEFEESGNCYLGTYLYYEGEDTFANLTDERVKAEYDEKTGLYSYNGKTCETEWDLNDAILDDFKETDPLFIRQKAVETQSV